MRRWILVGTPLLLSAFALTACGGGRSSDGGAPNGATSSDEVTIELAEVEGSGESGTATLTKIGDKTRVVLELRNPTTDSQPAHIHEGSCPDVNPQPLHGLLNVVQGRSETVVNRPLSELTAGGLAINVHQSNEDLGTFVACGNLPGEAGDAPVSDEGRGRFGY